MQALTASFDIYCWANDVHPRKYPRASFKMNSLAVNFTELWIAFLMIFKPRNYQELFIETCSENFGMARTSIKIYGVQHKTIDMGLGHIWLHDRFRIELY